GLGEGESGSRTASADSPHSPTLSPEGARESLVSRHYPNDLLISGFDILFFWDARMAMMGMHTQGQVPWKRLYLHGLVRAADGQKMSKSKGNVVDPLGLIDQYGADALRFFMAAMESQGRDVKMDERRVEGYRNFATKLWNAARFCQANGIAASTTLAAPPATLAINRWIVGEVVETLAALDKALAELRFDAAANAIYHFVWDRFCDWYLELVKPVLQKPSPLEGRGLREGESGTAHAPAAHSPSPGPSPEGEGEETRLVAGWVLDQILVMLHPFMPFVTEELWHAMGERANYPLITAKWPAAGGAVDTEARREVEWLIRVISSIRSARTELSIPAGARMSGYVAEGDDSFHAMLRRNWGWINRLARIDLRRLGNMPHECTTFFQVVVDDVTYRLELEGVIDIAAEKARLAKARAASEKERDSLAKRLDNPAFVDKAKSEAVAKARADHAHHAAEAERLATALARLG
ncbi:MAG: class I tRNA ligase family protein, partial [Novosphingobium sp.]